MVYKVVPGLTFELCQRGEFNEMIRTDILEVFHEPPFSFARRVAPNHLSTAYAWQSVRYLEEQGVMGIIGDCGFMLNFQRMVREGG